MNYQEKLLNYLISYLGEDVTIQDTERLNRYVVWYNEGLIGIRKVSEIIMNICYKYFLPSFIDDRINEFIVKEIK